MKTPEAVESAITARAENLLRDHQTSLYCRTDRLFAGLMAVQWLASLVAAYWIAPRTWEGLSSRTHPHVWTALFLGGVISLFPIILALAYPGRALTRHVIAAGQLLMSGLLIHLTGGQVETHFHIFGSLAFLAFYRDWRVLVTASIVTATDHALRGLFWPQSIYGVAVAESWRLPAHVGWVVFTDTFLTISIVQSVREMRNIAWRQARQEAAETELQQARESLELRVRERTVELAQANTALGEDIAKRRIAEEALQKESEFISAVVDTVGSLVIVLDPQGCIVRFNRACEHLTGYTSKEAEGRNFMDLFLVPGDAEAAWAVFKELVAGHFPNAHENDWVMRDGSRRLIAWSNTALLDAQGGVEYVIGTGTDITERKQIEAEREEALREAQERASHDPLTGLLNHRSFQKQFELEVARAERENTLLGIAVLDLDNFKFFNDAYGHAVGDEVLCLVAQRLRSVCRSYDTVARFGGDEFAILMPGADLNHASEIEARLAAELDDLTFLPGGWGTSVPITVSVGAALFPCNGRDRHDILRDADERLLRAKTGGETEAEAQMVRTSALRRVKGFSMLDSLVTAVDNKDRYTRRHSEDVMTYSLAIARHFELDDEILHTVAVAALLHDVGKIGVPDHILRKPGNLTEGEFVAIKQHPQMGAIIVQAVPGLEDTLDAVRHHHERWDGRGYPFGLAGEETPLIARLIAVADAFSAMTTDRPYRKGMNRAKALSILRSGAGTQWDPACVQALLCSEGMGASRHALAA